MERDTENKMLLSWIV